jgi:hypothetical protein
LFLKTYSMLHFTLSNKSKHLFVPKT